MPLEIPMQSNQGGDSGAADAFKPLVDSLDLVSKYLSDESPLFKRQNQLLQQLVQINQRQLRTQAQAGRGASGGAGGVGKQTEAISKNITTQDTASSALKSFESIVSLTTSPLSKFAKTTGFASVANIASIASTGKASLSANALSDATNTLNSAFDQTIKPLEELRKSFANAGAGARQTLGLGGASDVNPPAGSTAFGTSGSKSEAFGQSTTVDTKALQEQIDQLKEKIKETDAVFDPLEKQYNDLVVVTREATAAFVELGDGFGRVSIEEFQKRLQEASAKINEAAGEASVKLFSGLNVDEAEKAIAEFAHTMASTDLNDSLTSAHKKILDLGAEVDSLTMTMNASAAEIGSAAANTAAAMTQVSAATGSTGSTGSIAPTADFDALQTEVNNLSADLYQAGVDLQGAKFYLEEFQNNLANANKPMNVLTQEFDNIGDTGGILTDNLNSLFGEVQRAFGIVDLREFQNKLFTAADAFADQANKLNKAFDLDSMDKADLAFLQFAQRITNATQPLSEAHDRMLGLAAVAGNAEANFDKADEAAKKLADQLKIAQEALAAAGGPPVPAAAAVPAAGTAATGPAAEDKMKQFADEISADFKMLYGGIKDLIKATYTKTKEVGKGAVNVVKGTGSAIASPVETMKTGLGTALKGGYGAAKGAVKGAGSALSTGVTAGFSTALKGATGSLGALAKAFGMAGGPVTMLATTIATATIGNVIAFGAELTHGMDVMTGLTKATSFVGTYFGKLVNGALAPFAKGMNYASNALDRAAMAADLSGMAMRRQAELAKAAGEIQKTATASIMNAVKAPLTGLPDLIKQVASYVEVVDPAAAKLAQDSLRGFTAVIGKVLQPALGILVQGLNYVAGQLMSEQGFKGLSTAVAAIATMIVEKVKGIDFEAFIDDLLKSAATMIEALSNISSITMGLAEMFNGLIVIISTLWDGLSALASGVYTVVDFLVIAFMDGLKSVVNAFIAIARTFGSSMKYFELGDAVKSKFGEGPAKDKPEKPQAAAANLASLPVQNASFKGLADVGKEMQTRSFSAGVSLEKMQMEMATNINDLLKNPTASALFQAFKNMGGGFVAPDANAQGV